MQLNIEGQTVDPQKLVSARRTIITIGRLSDEVYNVVGIDDPSVDIFQCQLKHTDKGWILNNGQWRTDCPKGIHSRLQHACSVCMGRCVNPRPANPTYSWHMPATPTLLNGQPIQPEGVVLHDGDTIQIDRRL